MFKLNLTTFDFYHFLVFLPFYNIWGKMSRNGDCSKVQPRMSFSVPQNASMKDGCSITWRCLMNLNLQTVFYWTFFQTANVFLAQIVLRSFLIFVTCKNPIENIQKTNEQLTVDKPKRKIRHLSFLFWLKRAKANFLLKGYNLTLYLLHEITYIGTQRNVK